MGSAPSHDLKMAITSWAQSNHSNPHTNIRPCKAEVVLDGKQIGSSGGGMFFWIVLSGLGCINVLRSEVRLRQHGCSFRMRNKGA